MSVVACIFTLGQEQIELSTTDQQMLSGSEGLARQKALSIVTRMARLQRATSLVDVTQAGPGLDCFPAN